MNARKAHQIWIEQCEAGQTIKARFGLKATFDYLVGEKLVNFVSAATAHRSAMAVEAGYVWVNEVSKHFLGAPFGGFKQSGMGREECFEEMLSFTQEKNIHLKLRPSVA